MNAKTADAVRENCILKDREMALFDSLGGSRERRKAISTTNRFYQSNPSVCTKDATTGITLVALVITVVVLLLLVGITLVYVLGDNGVFGKASQAKVEMELAKIEEQAGTIYTDKFIEKQTGKIDNISNREIIDELINRGNSIEIRTAGEGNITRISLEPASILMDQNKTAQIKVKLEGPEDGNFYYAIVDGKFYKINFNDSQLTIEREAVIPEGKIEEQANIEVGTEYDTAIITNVGINQNEKTIEITSGEKDGDTTLIVQYRAQTATCKVTVKKQILATEVMLNETAYTVTGGQSWTNDVQLVATVKPENADNKEVTWKSSDTSIATVDSKGVVKAGSKGGEVTITATTKDGSNKTAICKITTEIFGRINANKTAYTDSEENTAQIPGGFAVGTSENVNKVTGGLVIQDSEGNQFVWIPIGNVKKDGTTTTITLGRYEFNATNGTPTLKQDADNYTKIVTLNGNSGTYHQELTTNSGNTAAKNLGDFVNKTKANGGYYLGRYEASGGSGNTTESVKSQYNQPAWSDVYQPTAATNCQNMYQGNEHVESDLINSYAWDTAIVFIQKYSGNSNYANKKSANDSSVGKLNTGKAGDKVCNIYDMASNCIEWCTEHSAYTEGGVSYSCVGRGGLYYDSNGTPARRVVSTPSFGLARHSFRPLCYVN